MPSLTKAKRQEIEQYILGFFDILDKSGTNSKYYQSLFAELSDAQFVKWISKKFPLYKRKRT